MTKPKPKGKTIADLQALHDKSVIIPNRIKSAIAALAASDDSWAYEIDFMKMAKPPIGAQDIAKFREQFADYWAEMPSVNGKSQVRRVWFATVAAKKEWEESVSG